MLNKIETFFVDKLENRIFLTKIASSFQVKIVSDWYDVKQKQILKENRYKFIRKNYKSSLQNALVDLFPEYQELTLAWKFQQVPKLYWENIDHQRLFFKELEKKFEINNPKEWYKIPLKKLTNINNTIYQKYSSFLTLFQNIYPNEIWYPWKFENSLSSNYWLSSTEENRKLLIKQIEHELKIKKISDWYNISWYSLQKYGLYKNNFNSQIDMLFFLYPNEIWQSWKLKNKPNSYWDGTLGLLRQRKLFDQISEKMKLKFINQWYQISFSDIVKNGGSTILLSFYRGSVFYSIIYLYPDEIWLPWKFSKVPTQFWNNSKNIIYFLKYCEKKFNIKQIEDWKYITYDGLVEIGAGTLLTKYKTVPDLLDFYFSLNVKST